MSLAEIQSAAGELSEHERGRLALWLLETLPPGHDGDSTADTIQEALRRDEELTFGKVKGLTAEEFWSAVAEQRQQWK
jgi:hypothetical protein